MDTQERVSRREEIPTQVGDLVLLSTNDLIFLKNRTRCPRLSSRYVGPFRVVTPPEGQPPHSGRWKNYAWLALPATLGDIMQPINLARLRRFVERPDNLGGKNVTPSSLALAAKWGRHCGTHIDKISAEDLAEFCVGHELEFILPEDYYPPDHNKHPFTGPRPVRAYDTYEDKKDGLQLAVYLLDVPLAPNAAELKYDTALLPIFATRRTASGAIWTLLRALKYSFPALTHLKDLLPNASTSVVFKDTMMPIHQVVADRLVRGGTVQELLVQFSKKDHENSAWIPEKFAPQPYVDDF